MSPHSCPISTPDLEPKPSHRDQCRTPKRVEIRRGLSGQILWGGATGRFGRTAFATAAATESSSRVLTVTLTTLRSVSALSCATASFSCAASRAANVARALQRQLPCDRAADAATAPSHQAPVCPRVRHPCAIHHRGSDIARYRSTIMVAASGLSPASNRSVVLSICRPFRPGNVAGGGRLHQRLGERVGRRLDRARLGRIGVYHRCQDG